MSKTSDVGNIGEDIACSYLRRHGYKIIERNYRKPFGELDIISISPDGLLVFIEVKTVSGPKPRVSSEDQLTKNKLGKLRKISSFYANRDDININIKEGWRIDLLAITTDGLSAKIRHYKNI